MDLQEVKNRLDQLNHVGEANGLVVNGFLIGAESTFIHNFAAGRVEISPPIADTAEEEIDYRLVYASWDGEREQDVTDLSDDDFIQFMRSEPAGLVEYK